MSDEAAFLATLAESPSDDTARLVYADWLDEQARPTEAAYLRAVVECAATGGAVPDSLIDLAEQLPRDWRLRTAARFALAIEWNDVAGQVRAVRLLTTLTGMVPVEALRFTQARPDGALLLMLAEDGDGLVRYYGSEKLVVRAEIGSLLGGRAPSSVTFAISARLWPTWDGHESAVLFVFCTFVAAALGVSRTQLGERFSGERMPELELSCGHSFRQAHTELGRLGSLLPPDDLALLTPDDPFAERTIELLLHPRVT